MVRTCWLGRSEVRQKLEQIRVRSRDGGRVIVRAVIDPIRLPEHLQAEGMSEELPR
jgi:ribosomal protein S28E/S33